MAFWDDAWNAANKFVVDVQTGGQGVQPGQTTDEYAAEAAAYEAPVAQAPVEPVLTENQSIVTGSPDQTGEYRVIDTNPEAPATQTFVEKYVEPTVESERVDYTKLADIGDSKTQALMREGYSPEQSTAMQRDIVMNELMAKGYTREQAAESREARYYQNEYDKARENKLTLSSEAHHDALASGLPQGPNPFEYAGDIAKMDIYKSQGVSNVPGTGLLPQYSGSLLGMANLSTKLERTGQMGDYGKLGKPFSSTEGILSLARQQEIGEAAATSKYNPAGWSVDRNIMKKYTPELAKGAGFNLFYKEAKLDEAKRELPDLLSTAYMSRIGTGPTGKLEVIPTSSVPRAPEKTFNIELESGDVVTRKESDYKINWLPDFGGKKVEAPALAGNVERTPVITKNIEKTSAGIVDSSRLAYGTELVSPDIKKSGEVIRPTAQRQEVKSMTDIELAKSGIEMPEFHGKNKDYDVLKVGGKVGSGETVGGLTMEKLGIQPLYRPPGMGPLRLMRRSRPTFPAIKRKSTPKVKSQVTKSRVVKPDPKVLDLTFLNKNMTPVYIGEDSFKFKGVNIDSIIKPASARTSVKTTVNINTSLGVKKPKTISKEVHIDIKLPKGHTNVLGNVSDVLHAVTNKTKTLKNIKMR
jgi:hypothetical protein